MALIFVVEARERLPIRQPEPALRPFQGLDGWFLVDAQHHRVLGWPEINTHDVRRLPGKAGVGADAPTAPPLQRYAVAPQHPPNLMGIISDSAHSTRHRLRGGRGVRHASPVWPSRPRPRLEPGLAMKLGEAIKSGRVIAFRYLSRMTGRTSEQRVQPHGILYGSRAYRDPTSPICRSPGAASAHTPSWRT